jgi:hypothetical protein
LVAATDQIRKELDCCVLVLHHPTKTKSAERGSSALRGGADTMISLERQGDGLVLVCDKQKDAEWFKPVPVRLEPFADSCVMVPTAPRADDAPIECGKKQGHRAALDALQLVSSRQQADGGPDWVRLKDWRGFVGAAETTFRRTTTALIEAGLVEKNSRGWYRLIADSNGTGSHGQHTANGPPLADSQKPTPRPPPSTKGGVAEWLANALPDNGSGVGAVLL